MASKRNGPLPSTSNLLFVAGNANQWLIAHSTSQRHCRKLSFSVLKHLCRPDLPPHPLELPKQSKTNRALRTVNCLFFNQNFKECWWWLISFQEKQNLWKLLRLSGKQVGIRSSTWAKCSKPSQKRHASMRKLGSHLMNNRNLKPSARRLIQNWKLRGLNGGKCRIETN